MRRSRAVQPRHRPMVLLVTRASRDNEALMDNARIAIVLLGLAAHAFIGGSAVLVLANLAMNVVS